MDIWSVCVQRERERWTSCEGQRCREILCVREIDAVLVLDSRIRRKMNSTIIIIILAQ